MAHDPARMAHNAKQKHQPLQCRSNADHHDLSTTWGECYDTSTEHRHNLKRHRALGIRDAAVLRLSLD